MKALLENIGAKTDSDLLADINRERAGMSLPLLNMVTADPLIKQMRKAYKASAQCAFDQLLEEQTRWQRKRTIAENKLAEVRRKIDGMLAKLVTQKRGQPLESEVK